MADTPQKASDYLSNLTIQLEEIEMRFAEWDQVQEKTAQKRQSIYDSFEARSVQLVEQKNRKSGQLLQAAERIITGAKNKVKTLRSDTEINAFFSADIMVDRARQIAQELLKMDDAAKSEEIQQQLLVVQQEAIRNLKDRNELYVDGDQILAMGKFRFAIQSQNVALSITYKNDGFYYHITGTSYFEPVVNAELNALRDVFEQEYVSENADVPRAVYFAWRMLQNYDPAKIPSDENLQKDIHEYLTSHPMEGYVKGVHDADAFTLTKTWLLLQNDLGVLIYQPEERAFAHLFWHYLPAVAREDFKTQIDAARFLKDHYQQRKEIQLFIEEASRAFRIFLKNHFPQLRIDANAAASYLYNKETGAIRISRQNHQIYVLFKEHLKADFIDKKYDDYMQELKGDPARLWALVESWIRRFASQKALPLSANVITELVALLIVEWDNKIEVDAVEATVAIKDLKSINTTNEPFLLDHYKWVSLLKHFDSVLVPHFNKLQQLKRALLQEKNNELKLENFRTEVLTTFVRNQLINQVYFPIIGSNFSKQIGEAGEAKRSDRSGLLLLVSPPGYGKTTLMEYIADKLGLVFIKINAPSLGHTITSVDPGEAKNAAAKNELKKLNLAFEMGDNVMLYLDDIQHCHPEFLQKFISLADGQRRMDGVFNGASKTYDLRGKRFALIMAGNPYTESGEVFKIPDMLANRADIYNLGDMTASNKEAFEMSMLENALTSNPYLRKLTQNGTENLYRLVAYLQDPESNLPNLDGNFVASEIQDYIKVVKHALQARSVVLKVNENYIKSAGIVDAFREEPPFKLQGSYRNMNKILANVQPIMNEDEVTALLLNHYNNESQTLTQDAEANLLKLHEIMGLMTPEQQERWDDIKVQFKKYRMLKGMPDQDKFAQIIAQMNQFVEGLEGIKDVLKDGRK